MRVSLVVVVLCALIGAAAATGESKPTVANVVYTEPSLNTELTDVIHPYAWASQMPSPHAEIDVTKEIDAEALNRFLEVQTYVKRDSAAARSLVEVASTAQRKGIFRAIGRGIKRGVKAIGRGLKRGVRAVGRALFGRRSWNSANPRGFSVVMRHGPINNPATYRTQKLKPVLSDFLKNPRAKHATGSFPGSDHFRRGTYGLRRRRMPYYSTKEGFGSSNPFRKANNFFNGPGDAFLPRSDKRSPMYAATHPGFFDLGARVDTGAPLPYGGYSSFRNHRFRAARNQGALTGQFASPSLPGANTQFLSDGSPNPYRPEEVAVKHTLPGAAPLPPMVTAPPPFVSGDNTFRNFYGDGAGGGEGAAAAGSEGGF